MDTGRTEARFTRSDALALAAGCVLAFIWRRSVALLRLYESREAPAAGALIFAAAAWAIVPAAAAQTREAYARRAVRGGHESLARALLRRADELRYAARQLPRHVLHGDLGLPLPGGIRFRGAASLIGPLCAPFSSWPRPFRALGALISRSHPTAGALAILGAGTMLTALYDWLRLGGAEGLAAYYSGFAGWLLGMGLPGL